MYNQVIPTKTEPEPYENEYDMNVKVFLEKICFCGLCNNNDKTDKTQYFKCHHYCCDWSDARRRCLYCGCNIKR